jgi:hypothetical protein
MPRSEAPNEIGSPATNSGNGTARAFFVCFFLPRRLRGAASCIRHIDTEDALQSSW